MAFRQKLQNRLTQIYSCMLKGLSRSLFIVKKVDLLPLWFS